MAYQSIGNFEKSDHYANKSLELDKKYQGGFAGYQPFKNIIKIIPIKFNDRKK